MLLKHTAWGCRSRHSQREHRRFTRNKSVEMRCGARRRGGEEEIEEGRGSQHTINTPVADEKMCRKEFWVWPGWPRVLERALLV